MVEIFDYPTLPEMPFLRELAEDLESTLNVIAYGGHEQNIHYIKESQEYFKKRYSKFLKHIHSDVGCYHIIPAYDCLQILLDQNLTSEQIKEEAINCIQENLIGGESDDYFLAFKEFYESTEIYR